MSSLGSLCLCGESCSSSAAEPAAKVTYQDHVLPIFRDKCLACHNADKARGDINLSAYAKVMEGGSSGKIVNPGDPDASKLLLVMSHKAEPFMPPKEPKLPDDAIAKVRAWIEQGALENAGSKAPVINKPKYDIALNSAAKGKPEGPPPMPGPKVRQEPVVRTAKPGAVAAIANSPWAPLVAVAGQKQVLLYNSDTLDLAGVLPFEHGSVHVLKFSRNGGLLLAGGGRGGKSGKVVVWNVVTGEKIFEVGDETDAVLAADISSDQTQIALGGPSKVVRVYSTRDGQLVREIRKHTDWIYTLEFSPDGVLLATGDRNGGLFVWEAFTGREFFNLRGHAAAITDVSWRADGNVLASASEDASVRLWEMENGNNIKNWGAHGGGTLSVEFAKDGRVVTSGRDRLTKVWDGNGAVQRQFEATPDLALRTTFTHDAGRVLTGDWSGQVKVWATADGKPLGVLSPNPPTAAERLALATKELTDRQAAFDKANATFAAAQAAAAKAATDLQAAQKASGETAAAAKAAADAVPAAKAAVDQANAKLANDQMTVAAKDSAAKAYSVAAVSVRADADKAPTNKALAEAAAKAQSVAAGALGELQAAQKAAADATAAVKTATDAFTVAQQKQTATAAAAQAAAKLVTDLTPAVKQTADALPPAKAALDQAAAALNEAKARVDKLKAVPVAAK